MSERFSPTPVEVTAPKKTLFEKRLGIRKYSIEDETPEVIAKWIEQIQEIHAALVRGDEESLMELMQGTKYEKNVSTVSALLETENLDEEDKKLLALGLWLLKDMKKWQEGQVRKKVLLGGKFSVGAHLESQNGFNCIDSSVLIDRVAPELGITGSVKKARIKNPYSHRYYETDSGKILDVWWGYQRGGLFQRRDDFEKRREEVDHPCGT